MKKVLQIILLLTIMGIITQVVLILVKTKHEIEYKIVSNNEIFDVKEVFENNQYHILIYDEKMKFSFVVDNQYNKKKGIVKDIDFTKEGNMMCIYPYLYKDNNFNIVCNDNGQIKSYYASKDNSLVSNFVTSLQSKGEANSSWQNEVPNKRTLDSLTIFYDNILENSKIYVWRYTGFYSISKEKDLLLNVTSKDVYSNSLGIKVDNYYIIPDYNQKYDFTRMIVYNMKDDVSKNIEFSEEISYDSYYNGVVDNKLYLFDRDSLIQYEINAKKKSYDIVGNKEKNALYYDGKFITKNIYDFENSKILFIEYNLPEELNDKSNVYKENDLYYYTENNNVYMYDDKLLTTSLMFTKASINDIQVESSQLYFVLGDTLYIYNQKNGMKPLITYKEFSFNKLNMYSVYAY